MVDRAFEDFLDSDDDAFFIEASHQFDSTIESIHTLEENASKNQSENHAFFNLKKKDNISSQETEKNIFDATEISSKECDTAVKNTIGVAKPAINSKINSSHCIEIPAEKCENAAKSILNKSRTSNVTLYSPNTSLKEHAKDVAIGTVASTSAENISCLNKTPVTSNNSSYIDSRFTPGFTPKAKKRKLPGPAGLFELFNGSKESEASSSEEMLDMEFENIVSSQFTPEHLSLISWQKLQTAVSSCPDLHSAVKHYSIQRVLQESSKKKLPKHVIAPFLCVLVKKLSYKGSSTVSVFMDDTGEINGKIDADVLSMYKEYLVEGTALILKKVTFLCNVLILKSENIVSLYHTDGTEKHPQSLDSLLKTSEPLKPMNCGCLIFPHHNLKDNKDKFSSPNSVPNYHKLDCFNHNQNRLNRISGQNKTISQISHHNNSINSSKVNKPTVSYDSNKSDNVLSQNKGVNKNVSNSVSDIPCEISSHVKSVRSDAFLENLLDEGNCIDEFDELLGNLDEKSFMEDL